MRDFEKISFKQFCKDVKEDIELYNKYKLPIRDSIASAGYDILLLEDIELKFNVRLVNQVGIVDADYYNNKDNEGHIFIKIQNEGKETVKFKAGEAIAQGIFLKYLATKSDKNLGIERSSDY